jgi:large subunit ribosomal protein L7/L12
VCYWIENQSSLVTLQARNAEDTGTLYVTNRRLEFAGENERRTIALQDIVSVQPFAGGVRIDVAGSPSVAFTAHSGELAETIARIRQDRPVTVTLLNCGPQKIQVIKAVRELTNLGIAEAKALVERTPAAIAIGVPQTQGLQLQARFQRLGASVSVE